MEFNPKYPILSGGLKSKPISNERLMRIIVEKEGFESKLALLEHAVYDSVVPGICTACLGTQECEPDARANWCDICETRTVRSCLDIEGII